MVVIIVIVRVIVMRVIMAFMIMTVVVMVVVMLTMVMVIMLMVVPVVMALVVVIVTVDDWAAEHFSIDPGAIGAGSEDELIAAEQAAMGRFNTAFFLLRLGRSFEAIDIVGWTVQLDHQLAAGRVKRDGKLADPVHVGTQLGHVFLRHGGRGGGQHQAGKKDAIHG